MTHPMKNSLLPFLSAALAVLLLSCERPAPEPEPTPEPQPEPDKTVTAVITANDVTVEEGKTVSIGAATNSSEAISYSSANTDIATVTTAGAVTGIKEGSTDITLSVPAVEGKFTAAEKTIKVTVTAAPAPPDDKPKAGTYTFVASPLKGKWEVGDQILIQGGYGPAAQVITLSADQISADGQTASADLSGDLFKYFTEPDYLYAVWPADAVKIEDGLTNKVIEFSVLDILLTQAYLEDTQFKFKDVSALISFTVSGDYDRVIIAGEQRPGLRYTGSFKNEYSSEKASTNKPKDDGYPFREEPLNDGGLNAIYFPGGMRFTGGFTLYFASGDNWTASYTYTEDINLKGGHSLELGDITAQLVPYSGDKPHMPELIGYKKYTVNINEFSGLCLSEDKSFLWAIDDNGKLGRIDITNNVGEVLETWSLGGDPEGVSIHPETGDLIVGNEDPVSVGIVKAPLSKGSKQTIVFKIKEAKGFGNSGMEGITYYKKDGDRDLIYCGTQTDANLYLCDLNAQVDNDKYTTLVAEPISLRQRFPGVLEVAGLSYDPINDWLWMIDSEAHKIFVFSGDASRLLCTYPLKTKSNEEGIVIDRSRNCVWIADDYGSPSYLYKYEFSGLDDFNIQ